MNKAAVLFFLGMFIFVSTSCVAFQNSGIQIPQQKNQRLIINNLNLSGNDFYSAYTSENIAQRHLAEMYLAGVLDATEGKLWCGYHIALPGSIQEQIYLGFKKQHRDSLDRRASNVISEILQKILPCRSSQ